MNITLLFIILIISLLVYLWIGNNASKGLKNSDDYYLMGKGLTFFPLLMTLVATQVGGGTLIGASDVAYNQGWWVLLYPLGACFGLIALGLGFGAKLRALNVSTTAQIFETIYDSKAQRKFASLLSIASLFFILVGQGIAIKKLFFSIGLVNPIIFIVFWGILVLYTVMGGLKAVVNTDIVQASFIIIVLLAAFSFTTFFPENTYVISNASNNISYQDIPWSQWLLMPLFFMFIGQDMGQRCFASKNGSIIKTAAISSGIIMMLCSLVAIYFGVLAKNAGIVISDNSSVLIESVKVFTNSTVSTFFLAAIFMAVISTADTLLCSVSSNIFCDFLQKDSDSRIPTAKIITAIIGCTCLLLSFLFNSVVTLLMLAYELSICVLLIPTLAVVLTPNPSRLASWAAMIAGATSLVGSYCIELPFYGPVLALIISLSAYVLCILALRIGVLSPEKQTI